MVEEALGPNGQDPAVLADLKVYATVNAPTERLRGIPFPGTFMLDRHGRVTSRFFEDYYWERNTVSNVLLRLGAAGTSVQATQASTEHLDLRTYPSDASVAVSGSEPTRPGSPSRSPRVSIRAGRRWRSPAVDMFRAH